MLYYFKKDKNTTEMHKKRFVQCTEKVLWLIEHVRSGIQSFMLEISRWTIFHCQIDQLKLIAVNSNINWEQSMLHHGGDSSQNILRISKSDIENHLYQLGYIHGFYVWVPHKLSKNLLNHISAYDSLLKHNEDIPLLKQIVTGNEKWLLGNNVQWNRSWGKWNEPLPTTPKAGLDPKKVVVCIW